MPNLGVVVVMRLQYVAPFRKLVGGSLVLKLRLKFGISFDTGLHDCLAGSRYVQICFPARKGVQLNRRVCQGPHQNQDSLEAVIRLATCCYRSQGGVTRPFPNGSGTAMSSGKHD